MTYDGFGGSFGLRGTIAIINFRSVPIGFGTSGFFLGDSVLIVPPTSPATARNILGDNF